MMTVIVHTRYVCPLVCVRCDGVNAPIDGAIVSSESHAASDKIQFTQQKLDIFLIHIQANKYEVKIFTFIKLIKKVQ